MAQAGGRGDTFGVQTGSHAATLAGAGRRARLNAGFARVAAGAPPESFFVGSAVFHYLGPAFAVLLFALVEPLGVAWLRIVTAAAIFALWRRPWAAFARLDGSGRRTVLAMGAVLAAMNACFYVSIDRLPLGVAFAFANAALFALYIVLAHRVAQGGKVSGIDGLGAAMLVAMLAITPIGGWSAAPALLDPIAVAAGIGVGISSSVIPYVCDQLAMARLSRAAYSLMVSLLPATATVIGVVVLAQIPSPAEILGVGFVVAAVAVHRERATSGQ